MNNATLERRRDPESAPGPKRTDVRHPPQQAKKAGGLPPMNHASKAHPKRNHRQPNYYNYHGHLRVPPGPRQASNKKHPDHNRYNRQLYQQRNLPLIIAAHNHSSQQSHIPPGQRLQRCLSNTTDTSFA